MSWNKICIDHTDKHTDWQTLYHNTSSSPKGSQAILSGQGEDKPKLEYLPEKFELSDKNLVFTSGKDGIFFEGIPVGNAISEGNKIKVKLFSDPNQMSFVKVVLDKSSDLEAR